jgi:hypothetical protein
MTTNWRLNAACADRDPDLFFPTETSMRGYRYARSICESCPVRQACLDEAMAEEAGKSQALRFGMRGGLTPAERAIPEGNHGTTAGESAHRRRGEKACPACLEAGAIYRSEWRRRREAAVS